jgi:hypothetical protein
MGRKVGVRCQMTLIHESLSTVPLRNHFLACQMMEAFEKEYGNLIIPLLQVVVSEEGDAILNC